MLAFDNFSRKKRRVEELESEATEAKGEVRQIEKQLEAKFDCIDLESAEALLVNIGKRRRKRQELYNEANKVFDAKWKDKLGGL